MMTMISSLSIGSFFEVSSSDYGGVHCTAILRLWDYTTRYGSKPKIKSILVLMKSWFDEIMVRLRHWFPFTILLYIKRADVYISYYLTDTKKSHLTRLNAKAVRDIPFKLFWLGRMLLWPFDQYEEIKNWPRNKNFSATNLYPQLVSKSRIK